LFRIVGQALPPAMSFACSIFSQSLTVAVL
jgi:hypothetical protein